ncbi:MAG: hypothetical protein AAFN11_21700 [Chloroflexota bacterium]
MAENKDMNTENPEVNDIPLQDEDDLETPMERFFFHQRRALEETGKALEALLPPEFRNHAGEASKEFARGFSIIVDAAIDELKKVSERAEEEEEQSADVDDTNDGDDDEPPTTTGKTKVRVKLD